MAQFQNNRCKRATQNGKANRKYIGGNQHTGQEESRNSWGSQGLHLPNHGCSVEHPKWRIGFCSILD